MKKITLIFLTLLTAACLVLATGCGKTDGTGSSASSFQSAELSKYVIVYPEGDDAYYDLANRLSDHILQTYGVFPIPTPDALSDPARYEIILGDTNRSDRVGRIMECTVTVDSGKMLIHAGGPYSAEQAVNHLCQTLFTGREFTLEDGEYFQRSFLETPNPVSDGASARIMSANVLADAFADSAYRSAGYRAEIFAGMLVSHTPDVLGLQETDENWNEILDSYLAKIEQTCGIAYARHLATYEDKVNYTSLLYRRDKFQVSDSGVKVFTWWTDSAFRHNYHMRNVSWAKFSPLDGSADFLVANTHWSYRTEHSDGNITLSGATAPIAVNELRTQCMEQTHAYMTALQQDFPGVPVVLTGDFNTSLPFFTESGWTPAGFRIVSEEAKSNHTAQSVVPESGHFDHIFAAGNYRICRYAYFGSTAPHNLLTDHPFVYTDLIF